jgi:putative CocE/NonD family hydrolase
VAFALVFALGPLSGCIGAYDGYRAFDADREYKNPGVFEGNYTFPGGVLKAGPYKAGEAEVVHLRSTLPAYASPVGESTSDGTVLITLAVWRPQNLTEPVPVVVDAGPYFENVHCAQPGPDGCVRWDNGTIDKPGQMTPFALANLLPHGYAVAQVAVRGTGTSGGCMDLMGPSEMHDLDQAITWLGEQPWSNGNVALWGVSYDGSTPWEAAATGNPHVRTIVPISGLPDVYGLMFHNGSAETRGAGMHDSVYWPYGFSPGFLDVEPPAQPPPETPLPRIPSVHPIQGVANGREQYQDTQNLLCPEVYEGAAMGGWARALANRGAEASTYWVERDHRAAVLQGYKGSVLLVHGLQDWNVDPHSAIPFNAQLRAAGLEVKELYGQWDHNTPNGLCVARAPAWATAPCRIDWAEIALRWFDRYLKGAADNDLGPSVQVQDDVGYWRNAEAFPASAPQWTEFHLSADGALAPGGAQAGEAMLKASSPSASGNFVEFRTGPMAEDLRWSGLAQLHVPFQAQGPGGQLAFWLFDEDAEGKVRAMMPDCARGRCEPGYGGNPNAPVVGHGQMNLRYYAGGEAQQTLAAGQTYTAMGEFEPADVLVPRGHRLALWVFQGQFPVNNGPTMTPSDVKILLGDDAVLRLPVITVDPQAIFPVPAVRTPSRDLYERMDVAKPMAPPTDSVPSDATIIVPVTPPTSVGAGTDAVRIGERRVTVFLG